MKFWGYDALMNRRPLSILLLGALACDSAPATPEDASTATPTSEPAIVADSTPQKICEHARDRVKQLSEIAAQAAEQDAPDDQKANARESGKEITDGVHSEFVEVCLELGSDDLRCMTEIDAYVDAVLPAKRGELECRAKDYTACHQWEADIEKAQASYGACFAVLERFTSTAWDRGRPEPKGGGVIGVMVPTESHTFTAKPYGNAAAVDEQGEAVPQVDLRQPTVHGPLDLDLVRRIVRAHRQEVLGCYKAGLSKNPSLSGEVTIAFTISATGKVSKSAAADSNSFTDQTVTNCVVKAVKRWTFPKPRGGGEVQVSHAFGLSTS
jgi:hypothetical protein